MRKTRFSVLVGSGFFKSESWKRVYEDDDGKRYVKVGKEFKCIEGTPCLDFLVSD